MLNTIFEQNILPESRYAIEKFCNLNNIINDVAFHSVCYKCTKYLGVFDGKKSIKCDSCDTIVDTSCPSNPCFIALIVPSAAVRYYLQKYEDHYENILKSEVHERNHIKDVYDGETYREILENLPADDR